jgi:23S rRNA (cytidine1920-2'-O)/16S rRNA (cytidine1409-2'-O)-methyltransferase
MSRARADRLLIAQGLAESREKAGSLFLAGRVFHGDQRVDKPGTLLDETTVLSVKGDLCPYVSRGGLKLAGVLAPLGIDPCEKLCADIGASTGGFTDVLLQHGARKVYAVDVGKGQLHQKLRSDPRVIVHEGINARFALHELLTEPVELAVMDLSFISLTKVLGAVRAVMAPNGAVCAMVKPQFELSPKEVSKGGVVHDDLLRMKAVDSVVAFAKTVGLIERGRQDSPVHGPAGNREVFVYFLVDPTVSIATDAAATHAAIVSPLPAPSLADERVNKRKRAP